MAERLRWVGQVAIVALLLAGCASRGEDPPVSEAPANADANSAAREGGRVGVLSGSAEPATARPNAPLGAGSSTPSAFTPPPPATVETLAVPGDLPAALVRSGRGGGPLIVYLPGMCSNANAYLQAFPEAARAHGGVVAIDGDKDCAGSPGFHTFTRDAARQHARIQAALTAAGLREVPPEGLTLIGYSQGASIAEDLLQRWPQIYPRIVLMGSPRNPDIARLKTARAVATMSCSLDVPGRMRDAVRRLEAAGVRAAYFEMPKCTHGNISDGERIFSELFQWLAKTS